jgi:hypothetical protein
MAEQPPNRDEPRWLLAPPAHGEAHVHIAVDTAANLTPELREAIEGVMRALQSEEVEGYAKPQPCPALQNCTPHDTCRPQTVAPCAIYESCRIIVSSGS